jgi:poly-gamma-glutamate capsule biosynthesis protein CapA/YwtB (metallophosphatase superfamily)
LSGNHVNDFGREGARRSLQFYRDNEIPIYGSGMNIEEACAPLRWEHNGNTFAFLAALAYGPSGAWATEDEPGACYYYDHKEQLLETVRALAKEVDIVAVELQYEETYFAYPTGNQVIEFRELRAAGADIVTGVQSHVPQALEPYGYLDAGGPGIIAYGLGNLFFDQMWSWETRTELYLRHTIYDGRVISTEILTGVLESYAQPRWATPEERAGILRTIFAGAPER